jgi:hypothetical protein
MIRSPFIIGFLSIIPGLGFFVLEQPRHGFGAAGIVVGFFLVAFIIPEKQISSICFQIALLVWLGQIYYAYQAAKLIKRQESGDVVVPREIMPLPPPPPGLSYRERLAFRVRETVRQQLNPGEILIAAILGQTVISFQSHALLGTVAIFTRRQHYVALTKYALILIEQDMLGKSVDIKREMLCDIKSIEMKKGLFLDRLYFDFGNNEFLNLEVTFLLRSQTRMISTAFEKHSIA